MIAPIAAATAVLLIAMAARRHADQRGPAARVVATALVVVAVTGHVLGGAAAVIAIEGAVRRRRARTEAQAATRLARVMPEMVVLFRLAAAAGLPVATAIGAVAERAPPPARDHLAVAVRRVRRGLPLDEVLCQLAADLGPGGAPLVATLRHSAATGVALAPALAELGERERSERRAETRAAIGRLTVTMVLPLVCCILPAALALAVVPVIIVSLTALGG